MSLRTRLVAGFTVLLFAAIAGLGVVAVSSTRSALTAQIDAQLRGVEARFGLRPRLGGGSFGPPGVGAETQLVRPLAYMSVDADGAIVSAVPSGFEDDPDPLPDPDSFDELLAAPEGIATIPSQDGSLDYRAIAVPTVDGGIGVGAVPLDDVDAAVSGLIGAVLASGAGLLVLGAAATWWTVRRELRPVDRMVETATTIASGDLTHRIPNADEATELGQLSAALNEMLTRIEEAFEHEKDAQERLKRFVADASHELRTPLAAVQGYTELYRKGALDDHEELDKAMQRIRKESARMQRLVDDLLLLAQLDRAQSMDQRRVGLSAIVRDVVTDSQAIEPNRPINVECSDPGYVIGDEQRLAQVVTNLLSNARTHTPAGTPVHVTLQRSNGRVTLEVIDDGPGLPADQLDRLFDRFHRVDTSRARQSGGTGLGLAIVAAIIEAHGGSVTAANDPGHGARFTIDLPSAKSFDQPG